MQLWDELLKTALLGTERNNKQWQAEGKLGELLANIQHSKNDPELHFLQCAAVVANYQRAGQQPAESLVALVNPANKESRPVVDDIQSLRFILTDDSFRPLLNEWLSHVKVHGYRVAEVMIPTLLDVALSDESSREEILAVIGERGIWLAQQNPRWQRLFIANQTDKIDDSVWQEANIKERITYLKQCRQHDPSKARILLAEVWSKEAARDRRQLIETLAVNLQTADQDFLEKALMDKSKDVCSRAAGLLVKLPTSALQQCLQQRLAQWLVLQESTSRVGKLMNQKARLTVNLPEQWDKSWQHDGINETAPKGKGQKAWWLEQMLERVDPQFWCEHWQLSVDDILSLIKKHEWRATLLQGWQRATLHFSNQDWASGLIRYDEQSDKIYWKILTTEAGEALLSEPLAKAKQLTQLRNAINQLINIEHPWSEDFSRQVILAWKNYLSSKKDTHDYYIYNVFRHAALYLDSSVLKHMQQQLEEFLNEDSPWHKILSETLSVVQFRHDMLENIRGDR